MKQMLRIGAESKATKDLIAGIMGILKSNSDEQTKQVALKTLESGTSVNNSVVSSCSFTTK